MSFSALALKTLFADVGLIQSDVPRYVAIANGLIREEVLSRMGNGLPRTGSYEDRSPS